MFFLKQILDHMRLLLSAVKMATQAGHHLRFVGWPALSQGVSLDVLIEQLIRVQFGAVAGQTNQPQTLGVFGDKLLRLPNDAPGDHRRSGISCP